MNKNPTFGMQGGGMTEVQLATDWYSGLLHIPAWRMNQWSTARRYSLYQKGTATATVSGAP